MSGSYNTVGRKRLMAYLKEHADRQFTVEELTEALSDVPPGTKHMGKSSIYRQLSELCEEGKVRKYHSDTQSARFYQYVERADCSHHLHLKCIMCGQLQHLDCDAGEELLDHIRHDHHFQVDGGQSILYGCCEACARRYAAEIERNGEVPADFISFLERQKEAEQDHTHTHDHNHEHNHDPHTKQDT